MQVPPPGLAAATKRLGWQHGYRFRTFPGFAFIDETAEDGCVCWFKRGAFGRVAILFVKSAPRGRFLCSDCTLDRQSERNSAS